LENKGLYVLVVDDQILMRRLAGDVLNTQGFQTLLAEGGHKCLELYEAYGEQIGCVLLDINMPDMDGYETFKRLRQLNPNIGIIFCTSYEVSSERLGEMMQRQRVTFLHKPYTMHGLVSQVENMMAKGTNMD
jgi:CheY-like chemotaxis protein